MIPSKEFIALSEMNKPTSDSPGDLWICRELQLVVCFNGHKRGQGFRKRRNTFTLYHDGKALMRGSPATWRDEDLNAHGWDPHKPIPGVGCRGSGERWEYIGNLFSMLPYEMLAARSA